MKLLSFFPPNVQVKTELNNICIVLMDQRRNFFPSFPVLVSLIGFSSFYVAQLFWLLQYTTWYLQTKISI